MRAVVVYESMFGNTRTVAEAIAAGLSSSMHAEIRSVFSTQPLDLEGTDLLVVGAPTHAHGMPSTRSRAAARDRAARAAGLELEADVTDPGLAGWLARFRPTHGLQVAAFDTRVDVPAILSGRASRSIAQRLRRRDLHLVGKPKSFLVDKDSKLLPGERVRAQAWGAQLAAELSCRTLRAPEQHLPHGATP